MRKKIAIGVGIFVILLLAIWQIGSWPRFVGKEGQIVHVYNWSDYIDEEIIRRFEQKTGIDVVYDVFDSNEILEAKLLAGASGYDVVVPSASFLERQIKAGVFAPLDTAQLPNLRHVDPEIAKIISTHDPGNRHGVNYLWGTTGFGYNRTEIAKRMANAPSQSWDMLFAPEIVSRFADCGVSLLDAPAEVIPAALHYLGLSPNSNKPQDLARARKLLESIRPYIRYFHSSRYISDLANGDICLAMGWSGDIFQSRARAQEAGRGVDIAYSVPIEGGAVWFDMLAIPANAPHPQNAHHFINFLLEPQIIARITNSVFFANGNAASLAFVDPGIKADKTIYPDQEARRELFTVKAKTFDEDHLLTRSWMMIKTGR